MARIAVGGFQHETNSFAPTPTRLADFIAADGWPGLSRGDVLFDAVAGINLPAAGFVAAAREAGHSLVPLLWCAAPPLSGHERRLRSRPRSARWIAGEPRAPSLRRATGTTAMRGWRARVD